MNRIKQNTAIAIALLLGVGLGVVVSRQSNLAHAEVQTGQQRLPVPSGAQQSVAVLEKMATTLQSIDARLSRVEDSLQRIANQSDKE